MQNDRITNHSCNFVSLSKQAEYVKLPYLYMKINPSFYASPVPDLTGCGNIYSCHTGFCAETSVGKRSSGVEKKMALLLFWAFLSLITVCMWGSELLGSVQPSGLSAKNARAAGWHTG